MCPLTRNVTFPICRNYNSVTQQYENCTGCEAAFYDTLSVTFGCRDVAQLCGGATSNATNRRYLQDDSSGSGVISYAAVVESFTTIASTNPFNANFEAAALITSLTLCLLFGMIAGFVYFRR